MANFWLTFRSAVLLPLLGCAATISANPAATTEPTGPQITVLYDAFGRSSTLQKDWGYSALVEYKGKRILFEVQRELDLAGTAAGNRLPQYRQRRLT
jgi:hypothetical protein